MVAPASMPPPPVRDAVLCSAEAACPPPPWCAVGHRMSQPRRLRLTRPRQARRIPPLPYLQSYAAPERQPVCRGHRKHYEPSGPPRAVCTRQTKSASGAPRSPLNVGSSRRHRLYLFHLGGHSHSGRPCVCGYLLRHLQRRSVPRTSPRHVPQPASGSQGFWFPLLLRCSGCSIPRRTVQSTLGRGL